MCGCRSADPCIDMPRIYIVFDKSSYVLAHIRSRKADFLRCMMSAPAAEVHIDVSYFTANAVKGPNHTILLHLVIKLHNFDIDKKCTQAGDVLLIMF